MEVFPWQFSKEASENNQLHLQTLVYLGGILAAVTFVSQLRQPAPYGRHDTKDRNWGPPVHQRVGHVLNDGLWGVIFFAFMYFVFYGWNGNSLNFLFAASWLVHFIHRGFIHPFVMRYSNLSIAVGIPITGLTLAYFSYAHATFLALVEYNHHYMTDLRFCIGSCLFLSGFFLNRWSDWTLRNLRTKSGVRKYFIPRGGLFEMISSPNYFGEMVEWLGWAIATWSPIGAIYFCFASATFIPRARHNHQWYAHQFKNYPEQRKIIIPFIY